MFLKSYLLPLLFSFSSNVRTLSPPVEADLEWHAPRSSWINNLDSVIEGNGVHGFIFNSSHLPQGTPYGTYNWCNMPHVRAKEYPVADEKYELTYVEVIHRHHKRTPYASNTFPQEAYPWYCSDEGLFFYGKPLGNATKSSAATYWSVYTTSTNLFAPSGFNGTCQFPQITREGLEDSWQHGKDLYGVYHDLLRFLPDSMDGRVTYRVTNNVITSQVAGMLVEGMYSPDSDVPLLIQPNSIDSLEPGYTCAPASSLYSTYGVGSNRSNWTAHLDRSAPLFSALDGVSGVPSDDEGFHRSFDHYFDNLSARQCHAKPLPCKIGGSTDCVTQEQANAVYRLGQYEYSYIYRDAPESLQAAVGSFGVWIAELAQNIRDRVDGKARVIYRHNIAHDGSVSRLLSILQVDVMVWPGMGSELVFELYRMKASGDERYVRILWGGQVLRSSNPSLGLVDMLPVDVLLAYIDGLVGPGASTVAAFCGVD